MVAMIIQPMGNKSNEEIEQERKELIDTLTEQGYEVLNTLLTEKDVIKDDPICYLAKSIELMSNADVVFCMRGWEEARGCKVEHLVAKEYGKEIIEL